MHDLRMWFSGAILALSAFNAAGCLRDETLDTNRAPMANAGADQELEFSGMPINITLDGSKSRDLDGKVVRYDWRLVAPEAGDGGMAMSMPDAGADDALDPRNVVKPKLELGRGTYTFILWVSDDGGAVSEPDTVTVKVGGDPVQECVAASYEGLDEPCRQCLCEQSEACQKAVPNCGKDCIGLIGCIAGFCPDFTMTMDTSCVITNCGKWIAGGMGGASAAGSCVQPCATQCTPSITAIVTGP